MLAALLLKGVLDGIIIAVPAGPVGVLCIRRTIFHGQMAGFLSGLGAATADAVFGIIAAFGLTVISDLLLDYRDWLRVGGGAFLLYIGISAFTADPLAGTQSEWPRYPALATRDRQWCVSIRPERCSKTTKRRSTD